MMGQYSALMSLLHKVITRTDRVKRVVVGIEEDNAEEMESTLPIIVEQYKRNILSTVALSKQFNLGVAYFMQPTFFPSTPNLTASEKKLININPSVWHGQDYYRYKKKFWDQASAMVRNLEKDISEQHVLVKDLTEMFTEKNKLPSVDIFGDHVHYTDQGRQIIVREIIKVIESSIIKRASKTAD
jgi:hypothetical protein